MSWAFRKKHVSHAIGIIGGGGANGDHNCSNNSVWRAVKASRTLRGGRS